MSWGLQRRMAVMIVLLIGSLAAALSVVIGERAREDFKREIGIALADTANQMANRLDQYMWGRSMEIRMMSELREFKNIQNAPEAEQLLNRLQQNIPAFSWIGVADRNGKVWAGTGHILVGDSLAQRPVFTEGIKDTFIGDVHDAVLLAKLLPNPSGEPIKFVDISMPIKDDFGNVQHVLAAHLRWEWAKQLEESMFEPMRDRKKAEIFIVSRNDHTVLLGPQPMMGKKLELESIRRAIAGENSWVQERWPDGQNYITGFDDGDGYLDFQGLRWIVLLRQPVHVAFETVDKLQTVIWMFALFFALLFAGAGWVWSGTFTRPIIELAKVADRLRFGNRDQIKPHKGIKEVEVLSDSLQELSRSISVAESELLKLEAIAYQDRLTGLPNRIGLDMFLNMHKARVLRQSGQALAVLFMDLDGFKTINDTLGHAVGDQVLQETAKRLSECIRKDEIVARIGGDEFLAILFVEKGHEKEVADMVAERIIQAVNAPVEVADHAVKVGCSIGCSFWNGAEDMNTVMRQADEALYKVKRTGKNRIEFA